MINNSIPAALLSKIGDYEIEINGAKVKVTVVDDFYVVSAKIDELESTLQTLPNRVVGLDVKSIKTTKSYVVQMLLLFVGTRCLIIQLCHLYSTPSTLKKFLADETICFLSTKFEEKVKNILFGRYGLKCSSGVEVIYFASRILKKANVEKYGLAELAGEVGMDIKEPIGECPDWTARSFSQEQIKYTIHNAYTTYVIGNKLVEMCL